MAIAKMMLLNIEFSQKQYDDVLLKLIEQDNFHPEPASKFVDSVHGLSVLNRENPYADLLNRMVQASENYGFKLNEINVESNVMNVIKADTFFCDLVSNADGYAHVKKELDAVIEENKDAMKQLEHVANMDVSFDDLFSCKYLQVRFGRLPISNVDKLEYYEGQPFILKRFHDDHQYTWCMYVTTPSKAPEIDNIFSSLYFERIHIPEFVHGTPELAIKEIQEESDAAKKMSDDLAKQISAMFEENKDELNRIYTIASHLNKTYEAQKYVTVLGGKSTVIGFAAKKDAEKIKKDFESIEGVDVKIRPGNGDSRLTPPTKLKNGWFSKPFKMFVEMYGVPAYTDVDPTPFVALTYTLLFGIMFGDVGQGLLLSLVGYIAYKKFHMELGAVGFRLGFSSAIFGVVFGSVFGSEELITPLIHPMSEDATMTLLIGAISIGICLTLISMIINVYTNLKRKNYGEAFFSQNGIAGFVFYVSILLMVAGTMALGLNLVNPITIIVFVVLPLILIFLKEALDRKLFEGEEMFPDGFGAFFVEAFFELFEVLLTFIANTMSYLRVGGFILSHAGMMLVVYTLANMFGSVGHLVVLIIGNIFVMCLEGLIVGIQVLRLEFYEMFSRYYEGNGIPFKSIKEK